MAAKMAQAPTRDEVQKLLETYRRTGKDVGTMDEFQAVVQALIDLGKASTGEARNDQDETGSSSDGGVTGNSLGGWDFFGCRRHRRRVLGAEPRFCRLEGDDEREVV
jgi:hypothetical protein